VEDFLAMLEAKDNKRPRETSEPSIVVVAISFIVKLALVLGLCYLSILGLKRFSNMKGTSGPAHSRIRVIENSQLGANRSLHLVEIGSRRLLVASTPSQVNLLAELDPVDPADVRPDEKPSAGMFKEQLATFLGQKPDSTRSAATVAELMRESNLHMQHKVREAGSLRGMLRNAWNK
jgi:flagellar biosynthetic protein FliO